MKEQVTNEQFTIFALMAIALVALGLLGIEAKEIAIAIGGGLIGYLKGQGSG